MTTHSAQDLFQTALTHHQSGRFVEARAFYEKGLKLAPNTADALSLFGQLLFTLGEADLGRRQIEKAMSIFPKKPDYPYALGACLLAHGEQATAITAFDCALALAPDNTECRIALARAFEASGQVGKALLQWEILFDKEVLEAYAAYPRLLIHEGRLTDAKTALSHALLKTTAHPETAAHIEALFATVFEKEGDLTLATASLQKAIAHKPQDAFLQGKLALLWMKQNKGTAALAAFEASIALLPKNGTLYFNYAIALSKLGHKEAAVSAYETALAYTPEALQAPALTNLANLLTEKISLSSHEEKTKAYALYQKARALSPDFAGAYLNEALLCLEDARRQEAVHLLEIAREKTPKNAASYAAVMTHLAFQKMHLCDWAGVALLEAEIFAQLEAGCDLPPFTVLSLPNTNARWQLKAAKNRAQTLRQETARYEPVSLQKHKGDRLRVAYLSSDFKSHATAYLMIEMLEAHDRTRFEIFGLSHGQHDQSPMRRRLEAAMEHFVDLSRLSVEAARAHIAALHLDILIDLKGYTEGNALSWLFPKLATVQMTWLGYPGTVCAPGIDYVIADERVLPKSLTPFFCEQIVYLPGSYQPNARYRKTTVTPTRESLCLPKDACVLAAFHQNYKITQPMFEMWLAILKAAPNTVLWLWASHLWAKEILMAHAAASGVPSHRLIFADSVPQEAHLARLALADLALDTYPCNGHTTTSDLLWAGVPVLTLQGEPFASRVAGSLLYEAGLGEWVSENMTDYQTKAITLCQNPDRLQKLQTRVKALREESPLFDAVGFARKLEAALNQVAKNPI